MMRPARLLASLALILMVSLGLSIAPRSAGLADDQPVRSFADSRQEYVEGELIVMFVDDAGREAPRAMQETFSSMLKDASAGSLDQLIQRNGVRKIQRVFRGLEDANGRLRYTARARAIEQRQKHTRRQPRLGPLDDVPALENVFVLELGAGVDVMAAAAEFAQDARVVYAQPNYRYHLTAEPLPPENYIPNDPFVSTNGVNWSEGAFGQTFPDLYGLQNTQSIEAWNLFDSNDDGAFGSGETRPGEGVVVAVIDSGLDATHPDGVTVWTNPGEIPNNGLDDDSNGFVDDVSGWDFHDGDASPADTHGHGTHVSGTIGAAPDNATGLIGVAPWVQIMPLRGLGDTGGDSVNLAAAVDYAVNMGADVLSNSWGGLGSDPTLTAAFTNAHTQGSLAIAAAGNDNGDVAINSPANIETVIAVAAVDVTDTRAFFSNFGYEVDISAPGVGTLSLSANAGNNWLVNDDPNRAVGANYMVISGTSMACPHVSGAAAVLISEYPNDTIDELRGRLRAGADLIDSQNPDYIGRLGAGRLNLYNSLMAVETPELAFDSVSTSGFSVGSSLASIVVGIRNHWQTTRGGVQGVLSTTNSSVTIENGSVNFGDIPIAGTATNASTPFVVRLGPEVTAGTKIDFDLTLTSSGYQVTLAFSGTRTIFEKASQATQLPSSTYLPWHAMIQDYTGDGNADVSLSAALSAHNLYRNQGDGTFQMTDTRPGFIFRSLMIDIDSDGDEDVLVISLNPTVNHVLLRNDAGTLTDITAGSGIPTGAMPALAAMDFDRDGRIDIIGGGVLLSVPEGGGRSTFMLRNNGDETFTDVFASSGLDKFAFNGITGTIGKIDVADYDNDGDSDFIILGKTGTGTRSLAIYQNDGSGFFTDVTTASFTGTMPTAAEATAHALAIGDYDNDGDLDLFVSRKAYDAAYLPSALYRNNGNATFTDVTLSTGELANTNIEGIYWGTEFFDYDNDGDLDLYVLHDNTPAREGFIETDSHTLFENNGDGTFTGVNDIAFGSEIRPTVGAAAIGDIDNDGLLDIYAPASLAGGNATDEGGMLRNAAIPVNNWIHLNLEGVTSNRDGYGARVIVTTGATSQIREIYTSAVDVTTAHFGLGAANVIDSVEVRWPGGVNQHWERVDVNQSLELVECAGALPASCGNGLCEEGGGEDCLSCPSDCNGKQSGKKSRQFCCGGGAGSTNPVSCSDNRCTSSGFSCTDSAATAACCGNGTCESGEDSCSCSFDCGTPPSQEDSDLMCNDGLDNDCNGVADCNDPSCASVCQPDPCGNQVCEPGLGEDCVTCSSDCNGKTSGKPSGQFCCGASVDCDDSRCSESGFVCEDPFICDDGICASGEDSCSCPQDCGAPPSQEVPGLTCDDGIDNDCNEVADCNDPSCASVCQPDPCGNQVCEPGLGEDCLTCALDCNGKTSGKPSSQFCCGANADCSDSRCSESGLVCTNDIDADGLLDIADNCLTLANGVGTNHVPNPRPNGSTQCDDDLDGFGNLCDCDFDNNGVCDLVDFDLMEAQFGLPVDSSNGVYDLDCDQDIGYSDFGIFTQGNGKQMGVEDPLLSGLACADPTSTAGVCPSP
jgi:subtilisin family serine protease